MFVIMATALVYLVGITPGKLMRSLCFGVVIYGLNHSPPPKKNHCPRHSLSLAPGALSGAIHIAKF